MVLPISMSVYEIQCGSLVHFCMVNSVIKKVDTIFSIWGVLRLAHTLSMGEKYGFENIIISISTCLIGQYDALIKSLRYAECSRAPNYILLLTDMVTRCGLLTAHGARSCLSVRTQPLTATGAPSQTSTIPYHTSITPYHTTLYQHDRACGMIWYGRCL